MRIISGFLLVVAACSVFGQSVYKINVINESPVQVLKELERDYGFRFSYDPEKLDEFRISCDIESNDRDRVLEEVLKYLPYRFSDVQGVFLVIPDRKKRINYPIVSGRVINEETGEPLAFAHVKGLNTGTIADLNGFFELKSSQNQPAISVSYVGYQPREVVLGPSPRGIVVGLQSNPSELPEVIINANTELGSFAEVSAFHFNTENLESLPSLGQVDVFKSLQLVPGISATDETYSGLTVRGSGAEQNLVLMDGFTIYHMDHLFGIFSTFNPFTVNRVSLYKGGFGARYGGRISSVIDSRMKAPSQEEINGGLNVNPTSYNIYMESPLGEKFSFIGSYRQSFYDLFRSSIYDSFIQQNRVDITQALEPTFDEEAVRLTPDFRFYDFNSKLRFTPGKNHNIDFNLFLSQDNYNGSFVEQDESFLYELVDNAGWGNVGASINWDIFKHSGLSNHFSTSYSGFSSLSEFIITERIEEVAEFDDLNDPDLLDTTFVFSDLEKANYLNDFSFKWEQNRDLLSFNKLSFGLEVNILNTDYDITFYDDWNENFNVSSGVGSAFIQYNFNEGDFNISAGLRGSYYEKTDQFYTEPRISGTYRFTDHLKLKGAFSVHHQFLNRISISPFGNSDQFYWVLSDDEIYPVMRGTHWIGGFTYNKSKWSLDVEVYSKYTTGILESEFVLYPDEELSENEEFEEYINYGDNFSSGVDWFIKRRGKQYTSWLSYSLSSSMNEFVEINDADPYPSLLDQRHEINWVHQYLLGPWQFGVSFIYGSGNPYTPANVDEQDELIVYDIERINSKRLPDYHRLDLSAKYSKTIRSVELSTGCTLFNLYNRKNIKSRRYSLFAEFDEDDDVLDETIIPIDLQLLGFTPNFFFEIRF